MYVERDGSVLFCVRIVLLKPTTGQTLKAQPATWSSDAGAD